MNFSRNELLQIQSLTLQQGEQVDKFYLKFIIVGLDIAMHIGVFTKKLKIQWESGLKLHVLLYRLFLLSIYSHIFRKKSSNFSIKVPNSLFQYFIITKKLTKCQSYWIKFFLGFHFITFYISSKKNKKTHLLIYNLNNLLLDDNNNFL